MLLSKNRTALAFDKESEKKLQQKFNSNVFERLNNKKTNNINFIKFILQNSDIIKKYLDKDDFKKINYKYDKEADYKNRINPFPYLVEINEKKYFNVYEVHKTKSEFLYNIIKGEDEILKMK